MENLEHQLLLQRKTARTFFWHRIRWDFISSRLHRHQVNSLVDVGAGSGIFADFVKRNFPQAKYFFVEPSATLAELLDLEFGNHQNLTRAESFGSIDAVLLLDVLEHIQNDEEFLKTLIGKMRPGAVMAMTVPAMKFIWSGFDDLVGHVRRYEKAELLQLFKKFESDFEVLECRYLFWELLPLAMHRKWKLRPGSLGKVDPLKESEVPNLPFVANQLLYIFSKIGYLFSRWMPFGTSLAVIGRKRSIKKGTSV